MPTPFLYEQQPPILEFAATVTACQPQGTGFAVALSQTAFYPEGGGQPADGGFLNELSVRDVQKQGDTIWHTLAQPLAVGSAVQGSIDPARRLELCQQHSGEHILSGLLHKMYGAENVGFHIGDAFLTMDTSVPLTAQQLQAAETAANEVVWQNHPITAAWHSPQQLQALAFRSKKEFSGAVRIVDIPTADRCACCGTHLQSTGQVGLIKITHWQKYKVGVRLFVVCGVRALRWAQQAGAQCAAIGGLLSAQPQGLSAAVQQQKQQLEGCRAALGQLQGQLFAQMAQQADPAAPALLQLPQATPEDLRRLAQQLTQRTPHLCAVFSPHGGQLRYALAQRSKAADLTPLCNALHQRFGGRGGGRGNLAQGSLCADFATVQAFLRQTLQG